MKVGTYLKDHVFRLVHSNHLVYNTCWEDPRCDRALLNLDADSKMVMITSAGCNALDYLLDNPGEIHCVDMNFRQNALLQLKMASLRETSYDQHFQLFGSGRCRQIENIYYLKLRSAMPVFARHYWDQNIRVFSGRGIKSSFYHFGSSGTLAWMTAGLLKSSSQIKSQIHTLFNATSLAQQAAIYYEIERKVLNGLAQWFVNRHLTMCLAGVPQSQQQLFTLKYKDGALGFIKECFRKVFTELPVHDNYFYKVYWQGHYSENCRPEYLNAAHFSTLQNRTHKIRTHTTTISDFLKSHPGKYSHYVLLDHQDWLAANNRAALEEEWDLILKNSRPGTKILLRSAAEEVNFFPAFVKKSVVFEKERTQQTHRLDRVGTYASVHLATVK